MKCEAFLTCMNCGENFLIDINDECLDGFACKCGSVLVIREKLRSKENQDERRIAVESKAVLNSPERDIVLKDVIVELERYWESKNHSPVEWISIVTEEVGEAAQEANNVYFRNYLPGEFRRELLHVAATAIAAVENIDKWINGRDYEEKKKGKQ